MGDKNNREDRNINQLVFDLCKIILIKGDTPDYQAIDEYVKKLTDKEKVILNENSSDSCKQDVIGIVQKELYSYIGEFSSPNEVGTPFAFDTMGNYQQFRNIFLNAYKRESNNSACPPAIFEYIFTYIKATSEQFRLFEIFYANSQTQLGVMISEKAQEFANDSFKKLAESAALQATEETKKIAEEIKIDAKVAERQVEIAVEKVKESVQAEIPNVIKTTSEHSVAILGIFAGIVLAVVAGLFYSSSVIDNINSANFYKLLCISALVGFVSLFLVVATFRFVAKLAGKDDTKFFSNGLIVFVSIVLLVVMLSGFVLQFIFPTQNSTEDVEESQIEQNVEINVPCNGNLSETNEKDNIYQNETKE